MKMRQGQFRSLPTFASAWATVVVLFVLMSANARAQSESLVDRISNERMVKFETRITQEINAALARYIDPSQYVLSVKVIWNRDILPATRNPGLNPEKQKLPGFPIFVRAPGQAFEDDTTPPFVRMVVKVLLDETLPVYYERFVRKITPIVARFDVTRGDQVIVLKETFPVRKASAEAPPPTLPERELMEQLGQPTFQQFQMPPQRTMGQPGQTMPGGGMTPRPNPMEAAQLAYEDGRYQDALRIVQSAFQQATTNQERAMYLGMEGSIYYTMKNQTAANAAWQRALVFDPTNLEVQRASAAINQSAQPVDSLPAPDTMQRMESAGSAEGGEILNEPLIEQPAQQPAVPAEGQQ